MMTSRRLFLSGIAALTVGIVTGCSRGGNQYVDINDVAYLATDALLGAVLGTPPEQRLMISGTPEAPLLEKEVYERVLLSTDIPGFVQESKGGLTEKELQAIEEGVIKNSNDYLGKNAYFKKDHFTVSSIPFPPKPESTEKALLATFTPATEEGGSPEDKQRGKAQTYVLIRLTVSDASSGKVLRVREFYSGRDVRKQNNGYHFR